MDPKQQKLNEMYNQEDVEQERNHFEQQFQNDDDFDQPRNIRQQSNQHSQGDIEDPHKLQQSSKIQINESESQQFKSGSLKLSNRAHIVSHGQPINNVFDHQAKQQNNQEISHISSEHIEPINGATETKTREASPNRYYSKEEAAPVAANSTLPANSPMVMSFGAMAPRQNRLVNIQYNSGMPQSAHLNHPQIPPQNVPQNVGQNVSQGVPQRQYQNIQNYPQIVIPQKFPSPLPSAIVQPTVSQTIIRSRVVSQVQRPPIYISQMKPQSQIIVPRGQQRYSPLSMNVSPTTDQGLQQFSRAPINMARQVNDQPTIVSFVRPTQIPQYANRSSGIFTQKPLSSREVSPVARHSARITFNNSLVVQPTQQNQPQRQVHQQQYLPQTPLLVQKTQQPYPIIQSQPAQVHTTYQPQPQPQYPMVHAHPPNFVPSLPLNQAHHSDVTKIEHWFSQSSVRYEQITTRIVTISQSAHHITEMISNMLQRETQRNKQQYIRHLLQQQSSLQEKLAQATSQLVAVNNQNNQYKARLQGQANTGPQISHEEQAMQFDNSEVLALREQCQAYERQIVGLTQIINKRQPSDRQNSDRSQANSQLSKTKNQLEKLRSVNSKLEQVIEKLTKDGIDLRNKYQLLRQQSQQSSIGKTSIEDELTKTIESQKIIIKKLEQQLIQASNVSASEEIVKSQQVGKDKSELEKAYESKRKAQEEKFMTIIESKKAYINQLQAEIIRYKTQIKNLKTTLKEREKLQNTFSLPIIEQKKPSVQDSQKIRKLSLDQQKLSKTLSQKENELDAVKQKIFEIQEEFDRTIDQKNEKIKQLHEQIISLNSKGVPAANDLQPPSNGQASNQSLPSFNADSSRPIVSDQSKSENDKQKNWLKTISSLEQQLNNKKEEINKIVKKISMSEQLQSEYQKLKDIVTQQDQELRELKKAADKKNLLQSQIQSLKKQTQNLQESLRIKNQKQQKLKQTINSLQSKVKGPDGDGASKEQMAILLQTMKKKQSQIIKLRQTNQLHLTNIQQLQKQVTILTQKFQSIQDGLNQERKQSQKSRGQYQHMENSRTKEPHHHNKGDENEVDRLKSTVKQLKSRIKQMEDSHLEMGQRVIDAVGDQQDFRQQYSKSQVKIFELEAAVKSKQNKIKHLETNLQTMKVKVNHTNKTEEDFINQQQIQMLRKKVAEYESRLNSSNTQNMIKTYKTRDYESIHVFEQKVIYDLKAENERLKSLLDKEGTAWRFAHYQSQRSGKSGGGRNHHQQNYVFNIQSRLTQFNKRLEQMILENRQLERTDRTRLSTKAVNHELLSLFEREKLVIVRRHQRQIQSLQARLTDLQRYCSSLENYQGLSTYNFEYNKKQTLNEAQNIFADQNSYYKEKNKQLEERVDVLLTLNKQLKNKLQQALKPGGEHNIDYYRQQVSQLERKIADLQNRIKSLTQQNSNILKDLQKFKSDKSSQHQLEGLQQKIQQLNVQILRLKQENGMLDADAKRYAQQIKDSSSQSLNNRTLLTEKQQKISSLQQLLKGHNSKAIDHEQQVIKSANQVQILKAENQRLQEIIQGRKNQQGDEIGKLKAEIADLKKQIGDYQQKSQDWENKKYENSQTINSLNIKIQNLQYSYRGQSQKVSGFNQRIRELDYKNYQLQSQLTKSQSLNYELQLKIDQLNNQIASLNRSVGQMKQEKDASAQSQGQISNLQQIIRKLKQQILLLKTNLSQLTSERQSFESQNTKFKNEIQSLKLKFGQLQAKGGQRQQLSTDIKYRLEFIRSIFIEFESLLSEIKVEQETRQKQIVIKIRSQIQLGLNLCSQVYAEL